MTHTPKLKFGSVCSGIEAASVAWHPLGWKAAWLAEIEPFPSTVLKHHYPDVPNLGDMTTLPDRIRANEVDAPDLFCGGTPCQAFSVAGLRQSLNDARGNLSLTFCEIADAIDHARSVHGQPGCIVFWENVPGVLSTPDNAFGCFLAQLCGGDEPLVAPDGWPNAGCVSGPSRTAAWRVLDAQYFGLAQRRRRVFVVASSRNDFDPAAVLFEFGGVRRDFAPSRQTGQSVAGTIASCSFSGGAGGRPEGAAGNHFVPVSNEPSGSVDYELNAYPIDGPTGTLMKGSPTGGGKPLPAVWWNGGDVAATMTTKSDGQRMPDKDNAQLVMVPVAFHPTQDPISSEDVCHSIGANDNATAAVAFAQNQLGEVRVGDVLNTINTNSNASGRNTPMVQQSMQVRRLTPVECERLQGFPDNYTAIPWRGKAAEQCPDGPRYKALGNSWAVPVVRWIGNRIALNLNKEM